MRVLTAEELDWVSGGQVGASPVPRTHQECNDMHVDANVLRGASAAGALGALYVTAQTGGVGAAAAWTVEAPVFGQMVNTVDRYERDCAGPYGNPTIPIVDDRPICPLEPSFPNTNTLLQLRDFRKD